MDIRQVNFGASAGPIGLVFEHLAGAGSALIGTARMRRGEQVPLKGESVHPADEYSYVLRGQVEIEIGGAVHRAGPGTFMLIPAGEGHVTRAAEDAEVLWWWIGPPQALSGLKAAYPHETAQMLAAQEANAMPS